MVPKILQYLKTHGERLDADIAKATGISLQEVRSSVAELSAKGEVIMCKLTRFEGGKLTGAKQYVADGHIADLLIVAGADALVRTPKELVDAIEAKAGPSQRRR